MFISGTLVKQEHEQKSLKPQGQEKSISHTWTVVKLSINLLK